MTFEARTVMRVSQAPDGGFALVEEPADRPVFKDYDAEPGEAPLTWARFDLSKWSLFTAQGDGVHVGGAALVFRSPEIKLLEGRDDVGLLWDIRVDPAYRRCGVGSALLDAVERSALERGARWLDLETQQINAPACRFYSCHGFQLQRVNPNAYPTCPDEIQLLWRKSLLRDSR